MLKWIDTLDIAIELCEKHPDVDPQWINFVDLQKLVLELEDLWMLVLVLIQIILILILKAV